MNRQNERKLNRRRFGRDWTVVYKEEAMTTMEQSGNARNTAAPKTHGKKKEKKS
jgi:hypothetical protein